MCKRVMCLILIIISIPSFSYAMGEICLFADTISFDISADIEELGTQQIWILYRPLDQEGYDCITGVEFMINWDTEILVEIGDPVYSDYAVSRIGQIQTGIGITFNRDIYIYGEYFFIGYFTVMGLEAIVSGSEPAVLSVLGTPSSGYYNPIILDCEDERFLHEVRGRSFVFPYEARVIDVEPSSWGAIKSMLK